MSFTQLIEVGGVADEQALRDHLAAWDEADAGAAPGYLRSRVLADLDEPGRYIVAVDFSSREEAEANSSREETGRWAEGLREVAGEASYRNLQQVYETGS